MRRGQRWQGLDTKAPSLPPLPPAHETNPMRGKPSGTESDALVYARHPERNSSLPHYVRIYEPAAFAEIPNRITHGRTGTAEGNRKLKGLTVVLTQHPTPKHPAQKSPDQKNPAQKNPAQKNPAPGGHRAGQGSRAPAGSAHRGPEVHSGQTARS